jgi:ABC-type dipeptide/oligopeptide/nickel transport system ATPase subunit
MNAIEIEDLDIAYGPTKVVHGVSLAIAEGESFALVGESGSGKSTILKAISGLAPDWTGKISVLGSPRAHAPDRAFAKACQMVFQDPYGSLHPRKTVDDCLAEPLAVHGIRRRRSRPALPLSLPAPAFRRPAPARGDRPCPDAGAAHPAP